MKRIPQVMLALEALEKEMAVLSSLESLQIYGGDGESGGDPMANGYCTFNNMAYIASHFNQHSNANQFLTNYLGGGCGGFNFDSKNNVTSLNTGTSNPCYGDFMDSHFNQTEVNFNDDTQFTNMQTAVRNGAVVSVFLNGHAYTIDHATANTGGFFNVIDTSHPNEPQYSMTLSACDLQSKGFDTVRLISGVNSSSFSASNGWSSAETSSVNPPPPPSGSTPSGQH